MISLPLKPTVVNKEKNRAVFDIEALHPGYGVTVGNCLRRVLLSSLEGAAVTQVKIKDVSHEFSTIPGVIEDVINIILNIKQLRFKMFTEEAQKASLKIKGEKEVRGSDLELSSQLELANKKAHIATLTNKKAELEIEFLIERGIGYIGKDTKKKEKLEVGTISLDATFTPVKRVSFRVENMRVGKKTDFDRLFLDIETDGTILPEEAFSQASEILRNHFEVFIQAFEKEPVLKKEKKEKKEKKGKKEKIEKKEKDEKKKKGKKA